MVNFIGEATTKLNYPTFNIRMKLCPLLGNVHKEPSCLSKNVKILMVVAFQIGEKLEPGVFQKRADVLSIKMGVDISTVLQEHVTARTQESR